MLFSELLFIPTKLGQDSTKPRHDETPTLKVSAQDSNDAQRFIYVSATAHGRKQCLFARAFYENPLSCRMGYAVKSLRFRFRRLMLRFNAKVDVKADVKEGFCSG